MNKEQIKKFIDDNVSYKEGWNIYIGDKNGTIYLQIQFNAKRHSSGLSEV